MNKVPKEYDLTTSARPEHVKSLFKQVIETGIQHGTVTIVKDKIHYEITTYRIDKDYTDGRHPDKVEFGTNLSEDLKRRDFTMNALALNLETGELIDEHGGREDINNRIIKTIGDPILRFTEDGLRPVRAMRFASVLGFQIESNTKEAIAKTKNITSKISVERLQDEIIKSFLGPAPSVLLTLLLEEGTLSLFIPELKEKVKPNGEYLLMQDTLPKTQLGFVLGAWLLAIDPYVSSSLAETSLKKLKFSNQMQKDAVFFLDLIQNLKKEQTNEEYPIRKKFLSPIKKHLNTRKMTPEDLFSCLKTIFPDWTKQAEGVWETSPPLLLSDLQINGKDLEKLYPNLPKERYGELLNFLLDQVLRSPNNNHFAHLSAQSAQFIDNL